jgi:hypothetical protein
MLQHLDTDSSRQLVRERHAELKREWQWVNPSQPDMVESRRRLRFRFGWLRTHLRSAGNAPADRVPSGHATSGQAS